MPTCYLLEDIKKEQAQALELQDTTIKTATEWTKKDDVHLYKGKIYIPNHSLLKPTILKEFHNAPEVGHGGIHKTFMRINNSFYWNHMKEEIT